MPCLEYILTYTKEGFVHPNPVLLLTFLCVKIKLDILYSLVCDFASIHCDIGILIYSLLVHLTRKFVSVEQAVLSHCKLLTRANCQSKYQYHDSSFQSQTQETIQFNCPHLFCFKSINLLFIFRLVLSVKLNILL